MNGAEVLLKTAASAGVDVCFANAGTTEMPIAVAFDEMPTIRPILGLFDRHPPSAHGGYVPGNRLCDMCCDGPPGNDVTVAGRPL